MTDHPRVWEPWHPEVGQRVRIVPHPECPLCADRDCAGLTGIVDSIDYSIDETDPAEWPFPSERDPGADVAGRYNWIRTDLPVHYRGAEGKIHEAFHGKPRMAEGIAVSAAELELIED